MAIEVGYTFEIPETIMGVTLLAMGTSIPDALSSLVVAQEGHGDMAVSSSIGSNIFDVTVCLPVPWLVFSLYQMNLPNSTFEYICILSNGLWLQIATLLGMVFATIVSIHLTGWKLNNKLGFLLLFLYILFVGQTIVVEVGGEAFGLKPRSCDGPRRLRVL